SGAGGNTYTGFSNTGWYKITTKPSKSNAWTYVAGTSATSIAADTTIGPKYAYYLRNMNAPTITITGQSTVYGLSGINLEASGKITKTLDLGTRSVSFSTVWYKGTGSDVASFYVSDVPTIYTYEERGTYACGLTASTTIGGATLSTYKKSGTATYTIEQLSLTLQYVGDNVINYNGQAQEFTYKVVVDSTATYSSLGGAALSGTDLTTVNQNLDKELTGTAWYNTSGKFEGSGVWNYGYGLKTKLISITFIPNIGSGLYAGTKDGNGNILFRDAGVYHVGGLDLACVKGSSSSAEEKSVVTSSLSATNTNFRWKTGLTGDDISATIMPRTLNIYAIYAAKTYGVLSDPAVSTLTDYTTLTESGLYAYDNDTDKNITGTKNSFLAIDILTEDYNTFYGNLAKLLKREEGHKKGTYDVYFDLFGLSDNRPLAALYNNYGIILGGADTNLTTFSSVGNGTNGGGINLYWVKASGTGSSFNLTVANQGNPFKNFTTSANALSSVQSYASTDALKTAVANFEILPAKLSGGSTSGNGGTYLYDGTNKGVSFSFDFPTVDVSYGTQSTAFYFVKAPSGATEATKTALVAAAKAALDEGKTSCVYGGTTYTFGTSATATSASTETRTIAFNRKSAGVYDILIFQATNKDFDLDGYTEINWTITPANVSITKTASSSNVFGNIDYGGYTFVFNGIASGDTVTLSATKTSPNGIGFRYEDFGTTLTPVNGTGYSLYGLYAGTYKVKYAVSGNTSRNDGNDALYGTPKTYNYTIDTSETSWNVSARTLATASSGASGSNVYLYSGYTSVITVSNFFASGFFTDDKIADGTAASIKVSVDSFKTNMTSGIAFGTTASGTTITAGAFNFASTGSIAFSFKAYDANAYSPSVNSVAFTYEANNYTNYSLSMKSISLTITPKKITVVWSLTGDTDGDFSVIYDGQNHTISAAWQVAASGTYSVSDGKIYYEDYDSATGKVVVTHSGTKASKELTGTLTAGTVKVKDGEDTYYTATLTQLSGNYEISNNI
ncbi:MAG: hypothetical protein ACI4M8_04765, partial [Christensenellales bacterium]